MANTNAILFKNQEHERFYYTYLAMTKTLDGLDCIKNCMKNICNRQEIMK